MLDILFAMNVAVYYDNAYSVYDTMIRKCVHIFPSLVIEIVFVLENVLTFFFFYVTIFEVGRVSYSRFRTLSLLV